MEVGHPAVETYKLTQKMERHSLLLVPSTYVGTSVKL